MAFISYDKIWRSEFYNSVCAKGKVQDKNLNQIQLKVNDTCERDEKKQQVFKLLMTQML